MSKRAVGMSVLGLMFVVVAAMAAGGCASSEERMAQHLLRHNEEMMKLSVEAKHRDAAKPVAAAREQWEYKVFGHPPTNGDQAEELFNQLGREGWEFFAATDHRVYAKRRLSD